MTVRIIPGNCVDVLRALPAASVHCVVTSPPYWGLRDYKIEPTVWGGDPACVHEWGQGLRRHKGGPHGNGVMLEGGRSVVEAQASCKDIDSGSFCRCGAWLGTHGLEPTIALFVANEVAIFREVWRVLRDDGTLWLNLGDSYAGGGGFYPNAPSNVAGAKQTTQGGAKQGGIPIGNGLKPKDLCGVPWRVAFALQADGWYLRQDIVWHKRNPMPESVVDRCTNSHEFIFLLAKSVRYFFDAEAIKEEATADNREFFRGNDSYTGGNSFDNSRRKSAEGRGHVENAGGRRNKRSVWSVPSAPYKEAHFATFPPALIEPCILAGTSERGCCTRCGAPWVRVIERARLNAAAGRETSTHGAKGNSNKDNGWSDDNFKPGHNYERRTLGWYPTCRCDDAPELPPYPDKPDDEALIDAWRTACDLVTARRKEICEPLGKIETRPAVVLDPFGGAGTTALVADRAQRDSVLIEINPEYVAMADRRVNRDSPLFAEVTIDREAAE